jgi:nucleoside-diphosphate-sugar epimerase
MIALFGSSGYVGSKLCEFLLKKKIKFIKLSLSKQNGYIHIKDFSFDEVSKVIYSHNVKCIINMHAQTDINNSYLNPEYEYTHNIKLTMTVLKTLINTKKKISYIFIGTATQIGYTNIKSPISLKMISQPSTSFDLSKQYCEDQIKLYKEKYNINAFTLRLSNVFGPGKNVNSSRGIINKMIYSALMDNKVTIYGNGKFYRDFIYIDDVVSAIYLATKFSHKLNNNNYYYISTNKGYSFIEFAKILSEFVSKLNDKKLDINYIPWPNNTHKINQRSFVGNSRNFIKITSWYRETDLVKNIKRYLRDIKYT